MAESRSIESTDAWRFVMSLRALCPSEFYGEPRVIQYGIKLAMRNGGTLLVWFKQGGFVSNLSCESASPGALILAKLEELVRGDLVGSNRRPALERAIGEWRSRAAIRLTLAASIEPSSTHGQPHKDGSMAGDAECDDPIGEIPASGTIGVRMNAHRLTHRSASGSGGESGWSQAIGRRCEQFAFEALCEVFGDRCARVEGHESRVVLRLAAGDRIFEWLNAETERYQSWDLQELDAATGEVLRRHEVKARTARLTATEQVLAIGYGDAYLIWRVDPDAGTCVRVKPQDILPEVIAEAKLRSEGAETSSVVASARASSESGDGPTMLVIGSATRDFCRSLLRSHVGYRGRFRGNLMVVFPVTPELEAVLPPSKSRVWVANRSQAGCALAKDAVAHLGTRSTSPSLTSLLIVAVQMCTQRGTERALRLASEAGVRESARLAGAKR